MGDPWDDPRARQWVEEVRRDTLPGIDQSAYFLTITPAGEPDVKLAVEVGLALLLDKPIIAVVPAGRTIPAKLAAVADRIVETGDIDTYDGQRELARRVRAAMDSIDEEREEAAHG